MPTTKKRPKCGFAFGIPNTSQRLLFPDQNYLNFQKIRVNLEQESRIRVQKGQRSKPGVSNSTTVICEKLEGMFLSDYSANIRSTETLLYISV